MPIALWISVMGPKYLKPQLIKDEDKKVNIQSVQIQHTTPLSKCINEHAECLNSQYSKRETSEVPPVPYLQWKLS